MREREKYKDHPMGILLMSILLLASRLTCKSPDK
jgi:hypothetical protein